MSTDWRVAPHIETALLRAGFQCARSEQALLDGVRRHARSELVDAARRAPAATLRALNPLAWLRHYPRVCAAVGVAAGVGLVLAVAGGRMDAARSSVATSRVATVRRPVRAWPGRLAEVADTLVTSFQRALLGAAAARLVFGPPVQPPEREAPIEREAPARADEIA